jgi:hypothetical protein
MPSLAQGAGEVGLRGEVHGVASVFFASKTYVLPPRHTVRGKGGG